MRERPYLIRLLVVSLGLLFLAAACIFYQTSYRAGAHLVQEFEARETQTLSVVEWLIREKAPYASHEALRERIVQISKHFAIRVTYMADGAVLAESDLGPAETAQMDNHSKRPEVLDAWSSGFGKATRYSSTLKKEMLYVAKRVEDAPGLPGGVLRIAVPYLSVSQVLDDSRMRFLAVVAAMALAACALAVFLVRRTQRVLRDFTQAVDGLGHGETPDKLRTCPGSEFKPLVDSINTLAKQARSSMRQLHDMRGQFDAVLANMTDAVAVLDQDGVILAHNAALETMLGGRKDCTGKHVLEAGLGLEILNALTDVQAGEEFSPRRVQARLGCGADADVDLAFFTTHRGEIRRILVLHDVSAIKNAERILRDFVIDASHELRTPLTSIQGYAATLLESPPEDPQQAHSMLGTILKKSKDMSGVVTRLLDKAAPQAKN